MRTNYMKAVIKVLLILALCGILTGCVVSIDRNDPIVGQWVYENGDNWYIVLENGEMYWVQTNVQGGYFTSVYEKEPGEYESLFSWEKNGSEYCVTYASGGAERDVRLEDDTLIFGDGVQEWYRVARREWLSLDEIYYSTFDIEKKAYISHPLSEIVDDQLLK